MVKFLIISDDFTGALDTGVQFSKRGIPTLVGTRMDVDINRIESGIEVLAIDTESRHLDPREAYDRVAAMAKKAVAAGIEHIYKKTDSTLRGNIGSELTALMDTMGGRELMFIPGYPALKRTTIGGNQYVDGKLLHETEFGRDPLEPMKDSYIPYIINKQSDVRVTIVGREYPGFPDHAGNGKTIYVFDSRDDRDIIEIGGLLKEKDRLRCFAGCAGFAQVLPDLLDIKKSTIPIPKRGKNTLVVCGSVNPVSLKQVKYAEEHGYPGVTLTPAQKIEANVWDCPEGRAFIEKTVCRIRENGRYIIKAVGSRQDQDACDRYLEAKGIKFENLSLHIAGSIGRLVKEILERVDMGTLVLFGGDTAVGVMDAIECYGMLTVSEIMPGIALSELIGGRFRINIVSKAGGFGSETVLSEVESYLDREVRMHGASNSIGGMK